MIAVKEKISQNNVILENPEKQTVSWRAFKLDLHKMSLHLECPTFRVFDISRELA